MPVLLRTNLCINPGFEIDTSNWSMVGPAGSAIARDTTQFSGGIASLKATWGTGAADTQAARFNLNVTAGTIYTMSADVFVPVGQPAVNLLVGTGNETKSAASTVTGTWQRLSVTNTATNSAPAYFDLRPVGAATLGQNAFIDKVLIEISSTPNPYFDGNGGSGSPFKTYAWTGPIDASTSTESSILDLAADSYSLSDIELRYWKARSGLGIGYSLQDYKVAAMKTILALSNLSVADLEWNYWKSLSGLANGSVQDHRETVTSKNDRTYYASFFK